MAKSLGQQLGQQVYEAMVAAKEFAQKVAPGLENAPGDLAAEGKRLATQGTMEIASVLFGGNGFVQYGPGQYAAPEHDHAQPSPPDREHDGMER